MKLVITGNTHSKHHDLAVPDGDVFIHVGDACLGLGKVANNKTMYDFCLGIVTNFM